MTELNVTGRSFLNDITSTKDDISGDWTVIVKMMEKRRIGDGEWEEKVLQAMCTHKTFEGAYTVAMNSALAQFRDAIELNKVDSLFSPEG
jgi:hypothetical protein